VGRTPIRVDNDPRGCILCPCVREAAKFGMSWVERIRLGVGIGIPVAGRICLYCRAGYGAPGDDWKESPDAGILGWRMLALIDCAYSKGRGRTVAE
jgi:hypothetical protein